MAKGSRNRPVPKVSRRSEIVKRQSSYIACDPSNTVFDSRSDQFRPGRRVGSVRRNRLDARPEAGVKLVSWVRVRAPDASVMVHSCNRIGLPAKARMNVKTC